MKFARDLVLGGESVLTDAEGNVRLIWTKKREGPTSQAIIDAIKSGLKDCSRAKIIPPPKLVVDDLATVYVCADWHINMLSWGKQTGTSWDSTIAQKVIGQAVNELVEHSPRASTAVILGLGDLLHSDGDDPFTPTNKHLLDTDGRYSQMHRIATLMLASTVERALKKHQTVVVRNLAGNHDPVGADTIGFALRLYFKDNPRVHVDDSPSKYWWWSWGNSLVGATHGHGPKPKDLPLIMATEAPKLWGKSEHRYIYTGHIHRETANEIRGVKVISFNSPIPPDEWHHTKGYKASRSIASVTLRKDGGELCRYYANIR